jgi:hypothetical protein
MKEKFQQNFTYFSLITEYFDKSVFLYGLFASVEYVGRSSHLSERSTFIYPTVVRVFLTPILCLGITWPAVKLVAKILDLLEHLVPIHIINTQR